MKSKIDELAGYMSNIKKAKDYTVPPRGIRVPRPLKPENYHDNHKDFAAKNTALSKRTA